MTEEDKPTTRKELMRPAQLLGIALVCAVFAGAVTAVSLGVFQARGTAGQNADTVQHALLLGGIVAGIAFIAVLLLMSLMLLAVKPSDVTKTIDSPVLFDSDKKKSEGTASGPAVGTDKR